jgi:hypothetical protein
VIARDQKPDTALDRVAGALSSEAVRTELYRYASNVAEHMPPDASSWYVVGANIQINSVTRRELTILAAEAKKGGTILAGFLGLLQWLPGARNVALASAAAAAAFTVVLIAVIGWGAFSLGSTAQENIRWKTWNQSACDSLANVRHDLRSQGADVQALDRERTRRGC